MPCVVRPTKVGVFEKRKLAFFLSSKAGEVGFFSQWVGIAKEICDVGQLNLECLMFSQYFIKRSVNLGSQFFHMASMSTSSCACQQQIQKFQSCVRFLGGDNTDWQCQLQFELSQIWLMWDQVSHTKFLYVNALWHYGICIELFKKIGDDRKDFSTCGIMGLVDLVTSRCYTGRGPWRNGCLPLC